jgi:hypothetical protein
MARRLAGFLAAGWVASLVLVVFGQAPAHGDDSGPVIAGTFGGQLKVTHSWVPGGWGVKSASRSYSFGKGCPVGTACSATRANDGSTQALTPQGGGFGWSGSEPIGCVDNVSGALKTNHGFDYTYKVHLVPAGTTTRDGVTYVNALRGTYEGRLAVNSTGRPFGCLINPQRVPTATEHGVYTLRLLPLAAPRLITSTPPLAVTQPPVAGTKTIPAFHLPQTHRQQASAAAVAAGRRSSVPGALTIPSEAIRNVGHRLPQDLLLVALLGLLMIFPAQLFNSTYEENHERIDRQLARLRLRRRTPVAIPTQPGPSSQGPPAAVEAVPSRGRRLAVFLGCLVVGTLLGGLLDPSFGANTASYTLLVGLFLAVLLAVLVAAFTGRLFRSATHHGSEWYLRAIPSALVIAALCVLVSRVTHFEPGYLYGVLGGAVFAAALDRRSEGRAEVAVSVVTLIVALAAWVVFDPVSRAADGSSPAFWLLSTDAFLSALFIGGIEGLLFGLIPLRFLPGYRIRRWSWVAWGVLTAVVLYTFVHVLLLPEAGYLGRSTAASVRLTSALFVAFGVVSALFWLYFRLRPGVESAAQEPAEEPAGEPVQASGEEPAGVASRPTSARGPRRVKVPASGTGAPPQVPQQGRPDEEGQ